MSNPVKDPTDIKRTPLYESHLALQAKMVPFAGWEMPVQYSGVIQEHTAVRSSVGIFDVSHMGEIWVLGARAKAFIDHLTCNNLSKLSDNRAQYNALINPKGGVIDDIIVYQFSEQRYLICVNASNTQIDFEWLIQHRWSDVTVEDASAGYGQIAVQGPKAVSLTTRILGKPDLAAIPSFGFREIDAVGTKIIVARTGYTGEDGFELFIPANYTQQIWSSLIEEGKGDGVTPAGLGARDSLRLEAALPLHGHELGPEISAIESGLGWIVKPEKGDFLGREILAKEKELGARRALVGFFVDSAGLARHGDSVFALAGHQIGVVTSGTKTPTVNKALGLALINREDALPDNKFEIEVRGKRLNAHVVSTPFYRRSRG